eukprot:TRINITY_DN37073_c0_g1_i1.p1 TRINITY_DN37073_c0_g1~~TRINITY_DN37073_c0_g1_i1.p1  ORF type:complete len:467 (+),score=78.74 TRINITY_DN37073_c0_g1_i1:37-1437(+)
MAVMQCPRCQAEVPAANMALHEARCAGKGLAPPAAPAMPVTSAMLSQRTGGGIEVEIVKALTWARSKPQEVVDALQERMRNYRGMEYFPPERKGGCVVTKEGVGVVQEAIDYMLALEPMDGFGSTSEEGLALAGEDHIADIGTTGTASHSSSDGTTSSERASRYGTYSLFGECLWYGSDLADARCMVLDLIVDDGVPSRGHRKGVLNPRYDSVGVAYGSHSTFGRMASMEFAGGWEPNIMFIRSRKLAGPVKMSDKVLAEAKARAGTQWSLGSCPICSESIKGGKVVDIPELGGKLHAACFKCTDCSCALAGGAYRVHSRKPFCKACFLKSYGDECAMCGKVIDGAMVSCSLGKIHLECLVCSSCHSPIGKNSFSTEGGVVSCQDCSAATQPGSSTSQRPSSSRRSSPRPSGRASRPLASAGSAVLAPASKAAAKAKVKAKAAPKVSMGKAKATTMSLAMDYASLA